MKKVYRIDVARRLVTLCWKELPPIELLKEVVNAAVTDYDFKPGMNFLWDREPALESPATVNYLRDALYYLEDLAERIGPHSWALVAHNSADFGKARMLESLCDGTKVTIRAFKSVDDAEEWMRNPVPYESNIVHFPTRTHSIQGPMLGPMFG
jgi:hypothetical protein